MEAMSETTEGAVEREAEKEATTGEPEKPKAPTPEERYAACFDEIEAVLRKHGCVIRAFPGPAEPVGRFGDSVQFQARFDIFPLAGR